MFLPGMSCVQPPARSSTTSAGHGHKALLIDMGRKPIYDFGEDTATAQQKELTWADVYERQQNSKASLLLVVGAPSRWTLADSFENSMRHDLTRWKFTTVYDAACNLYCAWDPMIWSSPNVSGSFRLRMGSNLFAADSIRLGNQEPAMSIHLKYKSGATPPTDAETFRLILTKLCSGTTHSDQKITNGVIEECWRKLIKMATTSQQWIIAGDLSCNTVTISNWFAHHDEEKMKKLKVDMTTHESRALTVISCDMNLAIAEPMDDPQSMVIQFHAARDSVHPPAPDNESARGSVEPPALKKTRTNSGRPFAGRNTRQPNVNSFTPSREPVEEEHRVPTCLAGDQFKKSTV